MKFKREQKNKLKFFLKLTIIFTLFMVFFVGFSDSIQATEKVNIKGGKVDYNQKKNEAVISGDVLAQYDKYYFHANEVVIKMEGDGEKILSTPENINMNPGEITGCDAKKPHYMFKANKINIYPNDYLEAYNVVFYELGGKLPLFYLPYLYISLSEERQRLVTEFGYSSKRGWFGKLTYNYNLLDNYPGQLYLDYYQKTGEAYGFRQHFIKNNYHQGYIYYYTQKNKIDLEGLFNTHLAAQYNYKKDNWMTNNRINYIYFDDYNLLEGLFEVNYQKEEQDITFDADYKKYEYSEKEDKQNSQVDLKINRDFENNLSLNVDYNLDSEIYLETIENDEREMELGFNVSKSFANNLDLDFDYNRDIDYEAGENIREENSNQIAVNYNWAENWYLELDYEFEELKEPEENLRSRESYESVLSYRKRFWKLDTILEREDPNFTEEDEVSFYRLPEFKFDYTPRSNFAYSLQLGNYYEDDSETEGYRGAGNINYSNRLRPIDWATFYTNQKLTGRFYSLKSKITKDDDPSQYIYASKQGMENI